MIGIDIEEIEAVRESVTYDDGQNMRVRGMEPCPFCGPLDGPLAPFVQYGPEWGDGSMDARVVCGCCHVATSRESAPRITVVDTGENVTKYAAVAFAVQKWNKRHKEE